MNYSLLSLSRDPNHTLLQQSFMSTNIEESDREMKNASDFGTPTYQLMPINLSTLYQIAFNTQSLHCKEGEHCFRMIDTVNHIERLLKKFLDKFNESEKASIRHCVREILICKNSFEFKMAELGAACHFIEKERDGSFIEKSFLSFYFNELQTQINRFEKNQENFADKESPSGKMTYLLKSFARMIFLSTERISVGGIYTILHIFENPDNALSEENHVRPLINEDHVLHLKAVLHTLLRQPLLWSILEKPLSYLHPDAELLIRAELKIAQTKSVSFIDAKIACLYALFYDLRQSSDSNCYAIPPFNIAIRTEPFRVFERLLELFETGNISLKEEGISFPLLSLVAHHITREPSLNDLRSKVSIASSVPLQTAFAVLGLDLPNVRDVPITTVNTFIDHTLQTRGRSQDTLLAKAIYCAFTQSVLQQTLLSVIQFLEINFSSQTITSKLQSTKESLILFLKEEIIKEIGRTHPHFQDKEKILTRFESKLNSYFWLQDYSIHSSFTTDGNLRILKENNKIDIQGEKENLTQMQSLFEAHRRLMMFKNGVFEPIVTMTQFIGKCSQILGEIEREASRDNPHMSSPLIPLIQVIPLIQAFFNSSLRRSLISFICQINKTTYGRLEPYHYYNIDALLFYRKGGNPSGISINFFNIRYEHKTFSIGSNEQHIVEICDWLNDFAKRSFLSIDSNIIFQCSSKNHSFILTPHRFASLWMTTNVRKVIKETIVDPAIHLLASPLSDIQMGSILFELDCKPEDIALFLMQHKNDFTSADRFKKCILEKIKENNEDIMTFNAAFDRYLLGVSIEELERSSCFSNIMQQLYSLDQSHSSYQEIHREFFYQLEFLDQLILTPLEIASHLKKTVIQKGFFQHETHEIEAFINKEFGRPIRYLVGNLNYRDAEKESPDHHLLTLGFNPYTLKIEFGLRINNKDMGLDSHLKKGLNELTIYSPTV
jgi:hypothetical protein